jgi:hypothetical protein
MLTSLRRFVVLAGAAVLTAGVLATASQAAYPNGGARVLWNSTQLVNPNYQVYPGLSINQYAYNIRTLGRAYSYVPPYALGYNPYPAYVNYGPVYRYSMPYAYPYAGYNPYAGYSPYAGYYNYYSSPYPYYP